MGMWTPDAIDKIVIHIGIVISAIASLIGVWQSSRAKAHAETAVAHAEAASVVTADTNSRITELANNTNDKMDKLIVATSAVAFQAGKDEHAAQGANK